MRIGTAVLFLAVAGYVLYTIVTNQAEFTVGFYVGVIAFLGILYWIYRVAARWGWLGIALRAGSIALALLKVLTLLRHPAP